MKSPLGRLRIVALLEGISYLLLGVTMPLKYALQIPEPNFYVGMIHGWLFVAYVLLAFQNHFIHRWSIKTLALVLVASLIPFGTFVLEMKILRKMSAATND